MKLWILNRAEEAGYDEARGFVVRASSAVNARRLASAQAGDEEPATWTDPKRSTCRELKSDGISGVVMYDFRNG